MRWCICRRSICEERGRGETVIAATVGRARRPPCAVLRLPSPPLYAQRQHTDTQQRLKWRGAEGLAVVYPRAVDMRGEGTRGDSDSSDGEKSQKAPLRCSPSPIAPSLRTTTAHRYTTAVNAEMGRVALRWCICGRSICEERGRGETVIAATAGRARRPPCAVLRLPSPPLYAQRQHTYTQQRVKRRGADWLAVVDRQAGDMRGEGCVSAGGRYARRGDERRQ